MGGWQLRFRRGQGIGGYCNNCRLGTGEKVDGKSSHVSKDNKRALRDDVDRCSRNMPQ